jgi:hypothetical protein
MKKVLVHLSMLCLMAALVLSLGACKKEEAVEEEPAASDAMEPAMTEPAMTDTGAMATEPAMTDTMGTDMGTEP